MLTRPELRRALAAAGWAVRPGLPPRGGTVGVWGDSPTAWRGLAVARGRGAQVIRIEDAFLRSVRPGRAGGAGPLGLMLDRTGLHFDGRAPSDLETLLASDPLNDLSLLARADLAIARMRRGHLSKYTAFDPDLPHPAPGYALIVDQTAGDASVRANLSGHADGRSAFLAMIADIRARDPGRRIVVKAHPETSAGARPGHLAAADGVEIADGPLSPWRLIDGAEEIHVLSSQLGFEAILAGRRPTVWGAPFYAGWGLTDDRTAHPRRPRRLTPAQLFAGAMILSPIWCDPATGARMEVEQALDWLEAGTTAWRQDRHGWTAAGMRLWKRPHMQAFFGDPGGVAFADAPRPPRRHMTWGVAPAPDDTARVEDGFLRSRGLGADLVPPLSLTLDDLGLYYDPHRESRLERILNGADALPDDARARAEALIARLIEGGVSKYNLAEGDVPPLPRGPRILVPGQVEDDASIRLGAGEVRTNAALLAAARARHPDATILWKPHPDVEAGLRPGAVADPDRWADATLTGVDAATALGVADRVVTMTSGLGFEAILRGVPVTTLGAPFYAGWGLTRHEGPALPRRTAQLDAAALAWGTLIAYPRYRDPILGRPCPPETVIWRLATGRLPTPGPANRLLAKAQGLMASRPFWRR
ncbi:MAG: capsular polysaccharide biosynthesis protein [Paracoccaceae bacterium]